MRLLEVILLAKEEFLEGHPLVLAVKLSALIERL